MQKINFIAVLALLILSITTSCNSPEMEIVFKSGKKDVPTPLHGLQIYHLKVKAIHADFPYDKLIDLSAAFHDVRVPDRASVFLPVQGQFTYYQFISTFKGESLVFPGENTSPIKDFHDILIIKTNNENRIIDAYHYTNEWAEYPADYDLFRVSKAGLFLKDGLNIDDLKLKRIFSWSTSDRDYLNDKGVLKLQP